jgi:hypothetical protein
MPPTMQPGRDQALDGRVAHTREERGGRQPLAPRTQAMVEQVRAATAHNPTLSRVCMGVIGLFPMITALLTPVMGSTPAAIVVAAIGGVTTMALLPRHGR